MGDYSDFCESFGGSASDPDFMDNWLDTYANTPAEKHYEYNEKLKRFYDQQSHSFKQIFSLFMDEDGRVAITHEKYKYIRIHHSKIDKNPDFYIRIRYSLADNKEQIVLDRLIKNGYLLKPTKSYQKDHTIYLSEKDSRVREQEIISVVSQLIEVIQTSERT
ncbi:hypothetical protein [Photobacterium alginatilyticum]|uniref:YozE SAM-like domain-containing protein n=1 Tax=Photobacterium alginatilyticum TaxID=1775171 RepID=A0ABW9YRK7_9GAMM|nr:hypothetical protein [Photobacterium alginatilyticum]NBI56340.1 hypothetical protein [Photobacterium alginatilyticum]